LENTSLPNEPNTPEIGYSQVAIVRAKDNHFSASEDFVANEVPVALVFNGISHAVMLASPLDLVDFAIGFSFSEGIINQRSEVYEIEEIHHPELGIEVHLTISTACFMRLKEHRRSLVGRTGCGICGIESLTSFETNNLPQQMGASELIDSPFAISQTALLNAFNELQQAQAINRITGSMHAAAWINAAGKVLLVREDLGRHNALDKLIGAIKSAPASYYPNSGCVIMTSRASYELAQKTARAGFALLATISAPTSLAIKHADQHGLTLVGFVRKGSLVVYAHPERVIS